MDTLKKKIVETISWIDKNCNIYGKMRMSRIGQQFNKFEKMNRSRIVQYVCILFLYGICEYFSSSWQYKFV